MLMADEVLVVLECNVKRVIALLLRFGCYPVTVLFCYPVVVEAVVE
jgi:hypothetical protein